MGKLINEQKRENGQGIKRINTDSFNEYLNTTTPTGDEQIQDIRNEEEKKEIKRKKGSLSSFYTDEEASYYDRIMASSKSVNEKLSVQIRDEVESEWGIIEAKKKPFFTQKLAAAKKDRKWGSTEGDEIKKAKSRFRNADVCTVREMASMTKYYKDKEKAGKITDKGSDTTYDPVLTEWVNTLTEGELTPEMFTDDYLSQNMPKMMDLARELQNADEVKQKFPKFYASLSDEKRVILETRSKIGAEMEEVLKDHLYLHGIEMKEKNHKTGLSLRREDPVRAIRHRDREELQDRYITKLRTFLGKALKNSEVDIARTYAESDTFRAETVPAETEKEINENAKAKEACGPELEISLTEMKKSYLLRDRMINEQKELIKIFENKELDKEKRREAARKIFTNNKRIRLVSRHAEHYREFVDFCLGKRERVSRGTLNFLIKDGNGDFGDLIAFRDAADAIEEGLIINEKVKLEEILKEKREEANARKLETREVSGFVVADYKEGEAGLTQEIRELEQKIKATPVYKKMSAEKFHELAIKYKYSDARKKREIVNGLNEKADKRLKESMDASEDLAKQCDLENNQDRTMEYFRDPFNTFKNLDHIMLVCRYHPGKDMPYTVKKELREKGLEPILKELLSITPEKLASMRYSEKTDINTPEYWHNKTLLRIGMDMRDFFDKLRNWDIALSDEEYAHLKAFGMVAQNIFAEMEEKELQATEPLTVLLGDEERVKKLNEANSNVFQKDGEGDGDIDAFAEKYSEESLGYTRKALRQKGSRGSKQTDIFNQVGNIMTRHFSGERSTAIVGNDITGDYKKEVENAGPLKDEIKKAQIFNDGFGANEGKIRLGIKRRAKMRNTMFAGEQTERWKKKFGTRSGSMKIESFKLLMRPVEMDENGALSDEAVKNQALNDRDFEAYLAGNEMEINAMLFRAGRKIAKINITPEMLKEDYLREHFLELFDDLQFVSGFADFYSEYPDFFESDAFTEEERDAIRQNLSFAGRISLLTNYCTSYVSSFGVLENGKEVTAPSHLKSDQEKKEYLRSNINNTKEHISNMLNDPGEGIQAYQEKLEKYEALFKEKPDEIRRASALYADRRAKYRKLKAKHDNLNGDINGLPESGRKKKLLAKLPELKVQLAKEMEEAKKEYDIAEKIRDHVFGNAAEPLSEEDQRFFEREGKDKVLHREYNKKLLEPELTEEKPEAAGTEEQEKKTEEKTEEKTGSVEIEEKVEKTEEKTGSLEIEEKVEEIKEKTESPVTEEKVEKTEEKKEEKEEKKESPEIEKNAEKQEEKKEELPPLPKYNVAVNLSVNDYEQQDLHNCWCVAGATLFNTFMGVKKGEEGSVDQRDMRRFSPPDEELKPYEEVEKMGLGISKEDYDFYVKDRREYMGEGRQEVGSIYETADFFIKKNRDMAVRRIAINLPALKKYMGTVEKTEDEKKADRILYNRQKKLFLDEVKAILETGNPVAILNGHDAHYRTITKIDGEKITLLESSGLKEEVKNIDDVLSRHDNGNMIEITWLSKIRPAEDEMAEQPNLKYSEEEGFGLKQQTEENARNPMWVEGISVSNEDKELGIIRSAYLPLKESPIKAKEPAQPVNEIHEEQKVNEIHEEQKVNEIHEEKPVNEIREEKQEESGDWVDALDEMSDFEHDMEFETDIEGLEEFGTIGGMEDGRLAAEIEHDRRLYEYEIDDGSVTIETIEERRDRIARENMEEVKKRINEPGIKVPGDLFMAAAKEKGMKGSFSKGFKAAAADFVSIIENFGVGDPDDEIFFKAMGLKSTVELVFVNGRPLSEYVKKNYNYGGEDPKVLKNYAAMIAARMEAPVVFLCPRVEKGELKYKPRYLPLEFSADYAHDKEKTQEYRKMGIINEQVLRGNVPLEPAIKAGRAYRERYNADAYGFSGIEDISDRLKKIKSTSNPNFRRFVDNFNTYYMVVERFAYEKVDKGSVARVYSYLSQAYDSVAEYMRGKKATEERHHIALAAKEELARHKKMLNNALTGGMLEDSSDRATFSRIFAAYKSIITKKSGSGSAGD